MPHAPLWLVIVLASAAALRLSLADHSLWFDEQASLFFSDQPFSRLWSDWLLRETNPALYYSLLRLWRFVFGSSDLAVRTMSVVASVVVIGLAFRATRRNYGKRAALIAALLAAASGQYLYYAEQARPYILILGLAFVALGALMQTVATEADDDDRRTAAIAFALSAAPACYLHVTMLLFPPIALAAVVVTDPARWWRSPRSLLPLAAAMLVVALAAGWAIRQAWLQIGTQGENFAAIGLVNPRMIAFTTAQTLFLSVRAGALGNVTAVIVGFLIATFVFRDRHTPQTRLLAWVIAWAVLAIGMIGMHVAIFVPRTILWISAAPAILLAAALARIGSTIVRAAAVGTVVALLAINQLGVARTLEQENWNEPVDRVSATSGATLLVQGEAMALLAEAACTRRLRSASCPYPVVAVVDRQDRADRWAQGLYRGPKVPIDDLPRYAQGKTVFLFRKAFLHSLPDSLHVRGMGNGVPSGGPPLIGPLPGANLR